MSTAPPPEDFYIMKYESGMLIDNSAEAIEADPKRKRATINSVKEVSDYFYFFKTFYLRDIFLISL
jgi:hypothetical protein